MPRSSHAPLRTPLIPLDGSSHSEHALRLAGALGQGKSELTLLHVVDSVEEGSAVAGGEVSRERLVAHADLSQRACFHRRRDPAQRAADRDRRSRPGANCFLCCELRLAPRASSGTAQDQDPHAASGGLARTCSTRTPPSSCASSRAQAQLQSRARASCPGSRRRSSARRCVGLSKCGSRRESEPSAGASRRAASRAR
ncbi:MAG TPA: hypothetical protein DEA08_31305 [Planctomycetes bacterium]|nr:hypothetical protein [Planctomycetota bacterium]